MGRGLRQAAAAASTAAHHRSARASTASGRGAAAGAPLGHHAGHPGVAEQSPVGRLRPRARSGTQGDRRARRPGRRRRAGSPPRLAAGRTSRAGRRGVTGGAKTQARRHGARRPRAAELVGDVADPAGHLGRSARRRTPRWRWRVRRARPRPRRRATLSQNVARVTAVVSVSTSDSDSAGAAPGSARRRRGSAPRGSGSSPPLTSTDDHQGDHHDDRGAHGEQDTGTAGHDRHPTDGRDTPRRRSAPSERVPSFR